MCRRNEKLDDESSVPLIVEEDSSSTEDDHYFSRSGAGSSSSSSSSSLSHGGISTSKNQPFVGLFAAVGAACCMAGYALVGDEQIDPLRGRDASGFLLLRQLIASALMLLLCCCRHGCETTCLTTADAQEAFTRRHRKLIHALGVFQALNGICFVEGLAYSGAFVASVCQLAIPVFTFAYSWAARLERFSALRTMAMMSIVVGCALTACGHGQAMHVGSAVHLHDESAADWRLAFGVVLLLIQSASFVGILVVQKRLLVDHPVSLVLAWSYALAAMWTLAYGVAVGSAFRLGRHMHRRRHHKELVIDYNGAANVFGAAVIGAVLYFELVGTATKHLPPTLVACTVTLEPLFVSLFGAFVLGQSTSPLEVGGYVFAALGAVAMSYLVREQQEESSRSRQVAVGDAEESDDSVVGASPLRRNKSGATLDEADDEAIAVTGEPRRSWETCHDRRGLGSVPQPRSPRGHATHDSDVFSSSAC